MRNLKTFEGRFDRDVPDLLTSNEDNIKRIAIIFEDQFGIEVSSKYLNGQQKYCMSFLNGSYIMKETIYELFMEVAFVSDGVLKLNCYHGDSKADTMHGTIEYTKVTSPEDFASKVEDDVTMYRTLINEVNELAYKRIEMENTYEHAKDDNERSLNKIVWTDLTSI